MPKAREAALQESGTQFDFNGGASLQKENMRGAGVEVASSASTLNPTLLACTLSRNASQGITIRSRNIAFGLRLAPLFASSQSTAAHQTESDEVVFQFSSQPDNGIEALSYRVGGSALQASVVLENASTQTTLEWQLELDAHLQARLQADGSVGIYGPQGVFSAPVQAGDSESARTLETARANAPCTHLLYTLPPFFVDGGDASTVTRVPWQLQGDRLTLALPEECLSGERVTLRSLFVVPSDASFFPGAQSTTSAAESVRDADADLEAAPDASPAGSTGTWASTSGMHNYRAAFGVAVWNNYVYAVGGFGDKRSTLTVEFSRFDPDSGQLGPWQVATALTTHRGDVGVTAANGYLYVVGGALLSPMASVEYAKIHDNGAPGAFTQTSALTTPRRTPGVAACNGYLYVVGGSNEHNQRLNTVEYAPINADGSLGAWQIAPSMNAFRSQPGVTVQNNYLYAVGGHDETGAEYAAIQEDGSLGEWITASSNLQFDYHGPGFAASDEYLYVIGGLNLGQRTTTTTVEFASIDKNTGSIGQWQTTSSKQTAAYDLAAVYWNGYVYALGGYVNMAKKPIPWVEFAQVIGSGEVAAWGVAENELDTAATSFGFAIWEGFLYAVGGCTEPGSYLATVQYARVKPEDGSVSAWKTSSNRLAGTRWGCGVAAWNGFLYAVGGMGPGYAGDLATVEYAKLNPEDGSVGAWTVSPNKLHYARSSLGLVACQGYLYAIGGRQLYASTPNVECCQLNEDGTTEAWTVTSTLDQVRLGPAVAVSGSRIYVMAGSWNMNSIAPAIYADVDLSDGTLSDWKATGTQLPQQNLGASAAAWEGFLFVAGGQGFNPPAFNDVYSSQIQPDGTLSSWKAVASLSTAREDFGFGVWNGYLYAAGGDEGTSDPITVLGSVEIAEIG